MQSKEQDEKYIREYKKMLKGFAEIAMEHPEMIDQLRIALKSSAALMLSNRPETVSEFRSLAQEVDAFLQACKTGEVDPQGFLKSLDKL